MTICTTCKGDGTLYEPRRISGEWIDADYVEVECHDCDGEGELIGEDEDEQLTEVRGDPLLRRRAA